MSKLNASIIKSSLYAINKVKYIPGMQLLARHLKSMSFTQQNTEGKIILYKKGI